MPYLFFFCCCQHYTVCLLISLGVLLKMCSDTVKGYTTKPAAWSWMRALTWEDMFRGINEKTCRQIFIKYWDR